MTPIVYLTAFHNGDFTLETLVADEPISIPDGTHGPKWISNYDGRFKGLIPIRQALTESRNAAAICRRTGTAPSSARSNAPFATAAPTCWTRNARIAAATCSNGRCGKA